jgi:hypothetical protein
MSKNPEETVEEFLLGTVPYGDIGKRHYLGEEVGICDYAIEIGLVFAGPIKGGIKTGGKALGKDASKFTQKIDKGLETLDLANASKKVEKPLLPGEEKIGTYGDLHKLREKGDNISAHHFSNSPPGNTVMWRGISRMADIE